MSSSLLDLAQALIRVPSLTPVTPDLLPAASRSLDLLQAFAEAHHGSCERLRFNGGHARWTYEVDNLFAHWPGDREIGHICFIGHTDIVPPGDSASWQTDPFSGEIVGDLLMGRGATDMKSAVAAFCYALGTFLDEQPAQRPTVSLVITTDEEWAAVNGTKRVLNWMRSKSIAPDYVLIGEPSSPEIFGTHIKIGRRGSLNGVVRAEGVQGHAAYPDLFINPNRSLIAALARIQSHIWDDSLEGMPATSVEITAYRSGDFNQTAIIPSTAEALWNIRFTPQQSVGTLVTLMEKLLEDTSGPNKGTSAGAMAALEVRANVDSVSMPYYSPAASFAQLVIDSVATTTGSAPIVDAAGGTTDGRFVGSAFPNAQIVELGLPENGGHTASRDRGGMHQIDECCSVSDLVKLSKSYGRILKRMVSRT
ncbi:MAG: succinyl-diaminopimelate desuccinylase [Pseudomonadota bacterium]